MNYTYRYLKCGLIIRTHLQLCIYDMNTGTVIEIQVQYLFRSRPALQFFIIILYVAFTLHFTHVQM